MRRSLIATAILIPALLLAPACGGSSSDNPRLEPDPSPAAISTSEPPGTHNGWDAQTLAASVKAEFLRDPAFSDLTDVGCVYDRENDWQCLLQYEGEYSGDSLIVTASPDGTWISR